MAEKQYIERGAAKDAIFEYICGHTMSKFPSKELLKASKMGAEGALNEIDYVPTADVAPVVHGEWIVTKTEFGWNCSECPSEYTCSVCGRTEPRKEPYCHCGAKMGRERKGA